MNEVLEALKGFGWIAALGLIVYLFFQDLLKEAAAKARTAVWNLIYQRLAGSRLLRRRALSRYRKGLIEDAERITVPFRPNQPLTLSDIYVALKVIGAKDKGAVDAWDLLSHHPRLVVTGQPGAGKSMLLRHLAASRVRGSGRTANREPLPVPLQLHRLVREADAGGSVEAHLVDAFERFGFPHADEFIDAALDKGRLLLLLDGFDEVPTTERPEVARRVEDFLSRHRACPAIVTCRTAVYHGEFNAIADQIVELEPFQDQQIQAFLDSWGKSMPPEKSAVQLMAALREQPKLLAAARNPLLLTIVAHLYSDNPNYVLPSSRAEFYSQAATILLDQWQGHLRQNEFERPEKSTILSELALEMQENSTDADRDRRTITREDAFARATKAMPNLGRKAEDVGPILREIVERSGLLLSIDGGSRYAFAHLTFQEYFAAEALLNRPETLTSSFAADPDTWREVVVLSCGLAPDSTAMIEEIRRADEEVALACVAEARSVRQDVASSILDPIVGRVISGDADEATQRGLGAVAADIRPRGEEVLSSLVTALRNASNLRARLSIATALSASNRLRAAETLVKRLDDDSRLVAAIVRLGDLAVPSLIARANGNSGNRELCRCLASIGTPDAAKALIAVMLEGGELETPAAWGVAKVVGNAAVMTHVDLPVVSEQMRRSHESLDWVWAPFDQSEGSSLSWIVGRAAALMRLTREERLAIATPDPRIGAVLCAMESSRPLDTLVTNRPAMPRLVKAATATCEGAKFHYKSDGHIEAQLEDPRPWTRGEMKLRWRAGRRIGDVGTYRDLLTLVADYQTASQRSAEGAELMGEFADALIDSVDHDRVWARLMRGLPVSLRIDLLTRLTAPTAVNRDTWAAVRGQVSFQVARSSGYALALAIALFLSAVALIHGVRALFDGDFGPIASLLAVAACLSIVASWIWMRTPKDPDAHGGIRDRKLLQAMLGFAGAPILASTHSTSELRPWGEIPSLVTMGFLPGVCWLATDAIAQAVPLLLAVLLVVALLASSIAIVINGQVRELRLETPLRGLFAMNEEAEAPLDAQPSG